MIWVKTRHSLDLPELRQSTPSRSATNGEDDPPMQSVGTSRRVDGRSTDAFDVYRRSVFGMADRRITECWTALARLSRTFVCASFSRWLLPRG